MKSQNLLKFVIFEFKSCLIWLSNKYRVVTKASELAAILNSDFNQSRVINNPTFLSAKFCFVVIFCNIAL